MKALGIPTPSDQSFADIFGPTLLKSVGQPGLPTLEALGDAEVVAVYFSAHWCPPCRQFTPVLTKVFRDLVAAGKKLAIVFASADKDEAGFKSYFGTMPWLAIPFENREVNQRLGARLRVSGIPSLVLLHRNGGVLSKDGRGLVLKDATAASWWPAAPGAEVEVEEPSAARDNVGFQAAIECFHEPIDFTLDSTIAEGRDVATVVSEGEHVLETPISNCRVFASWSARACECVFMCVCDFCS
jgi:thiol-disulfide isomerase/thioredoxin